MSNTSADNTEALLQYNNLYTDYRAEIVAINMMRLYSDIDHIFLKRLGGNDRPFNKDIGSIKSSLYNLDEKVVTIETWRESIYDYIPQGVFHTPTLGNLDDGVDNIIFRIRKQKEIEENARKLFHPFELESFFLKFEALLVENEYDILSESDVLVDMVSELWTLLKSLDEDTARIFVYMLPFFHATKGNKRWFEKCLTAFLGVPVTISFVPNRIENDDNVYDAFTLSEARLGISTVLGGNHLDGERNWCLHIGPVPYDYLEKYIPQSDHRKLLYRLYDYCLPATVKVEEQIITENNENTFILTAKGNTNLLGYSTFL